MIRSIGEGTGMVLFRRLLGEVLRERRLERGMTLRQVSAEARVSLGYISEIERGQKEASSELLSSLCGALEARLSEVLHDVSRAVAIEEAVLTPTPISVKALDTETVAGDEVASAA